MGLLKSLLPQQAELFLVIPNEFKSQVEILSPGCSQNRFLKQQNLHCMRGESGVGSGWEEWGEKRDCDRQSNKE